MREESWWTFRICFFLFLSGEGKGESEAPGRGGGSVFIENPRRGSRKRGGGGEWPVSAGNLGGGAKYFFFGPETPAKGIQALSWGGGGGQSSILGGILRDNLGEGDCESKIATRLWAVNI